MGDLLHQLELGLRQLPGLRRGAFFFHAQQGPYGETEEAAQSHQLFDLRQGRVGLPFINGLAGDAKLFAQGLLAQAQGFSILRDALSCGHRSSFHAKVQFSML